MSIFKKITSFFSKDKTPTVEPIDIFTSTEEVGVVSISEELPISTPIVKPSFLEDFKNEAIKPQLPFNIENLYTHQKDSLEVIKTSDKGIVCMPTGTGKSITQAVCISDDIIANSNSFRMYVVNAPRIILTYQLLKEVYKVLVSRGIDARYMFVHSGGTTNETELESIRMSSVIEGNVIPYSQIISGTSVEDIKDMMLKAQTENLPIIFFSTYNSAENIEKARKIACLPKISITISDEAQYLVQEQFHDILHVLTSNRSYFFTATTIHTPSDSGRGMNNTDVYGDVLYSMTPRQAIKLGFMVRPRMHFVTTAGIYTPDDYNKSLPFIIKDTFTQHATVLGSVLPKILISVKGTQDIKKFLGSKECKSLIDNDVMIFAIASNDEIGCTVNNERVRRQDFLRILKICGEDRTKKLIVLHYDILSEGLDISGFTGIMPLRSLSKSKFLQTYGRAARLDPSDRANLKDGSLSPDELDKMNKPYAYVIIPNITNNNEDDKANFVQLVKELREYGFDASEDIVCSEMKRGIPEVENLNGLNDVDRRIPNFGKLIQDLEMNIEAEADAKLTKEEFLNKILDDL